MTMRRGHHVSSVLKAMGARTGEPDVEEDAVESLDDIVSTEPE
jgi:hypothetical protein